MSHRPRPIPAELHAATADAIRRAETILRDALDALDGHLDAPTRDVWLRVIGSGHGIDKIRLRMERFAGDGWGVYWRSDVPSPSPVPDRTRAGQPGALGGALRG